jgi:lipopolysaccharide export system protein LptC
MMTFNNGALVTRETGMSATFRTATAYMKEQMVVSKTPVVVRLHESTIEAQTMTLYTGEERAIFEGAVKTHLERHPTPDTKAEVPPSPAGPAAGTLAAPQ